uniref:C3H1-type domain-containing protein n=1 Tax=Alexandrium monilatum TaxID=311494 RepID=A0A7S4S731_9DINO
MCALRDVDSETASDSGSFAAKEKIDECPPRGRARTSPATVYPCERTPSPDRYHRDAFAPPPASPVRQSAVVLAPAQPMTCIAVGSRSCPTVGSIGHPFSCGQGCKFAKKPRGCKDGGLCDRCHLCVWRRQKKPGVREV